MNVATQQMAKRQHQLTLLMNLRWLGIPGYCHSGNGQTGRHDWEECPGSDPFANSGIMNRSCVWTGKILFFPNQWHMTSGNVLKTRVNAEPLILFVTGKIFGRKCAKKEIFRRMRGRGRLPNDKIHEPLKTKMPYDFLRTDL